MGTDVFVSYSARNKSAADAAVAALERVGVRCWIAPRDIPPGEEWAAAIVKGINASRMMVVIFSAGANASEHVSRFLGLRGPPQTTHRRSGESIRRGERSGSGVAGGRDSSEVMV